MTERLFYIATLLTLLCCSNHPGEVSIQGEFAHLEQGEFYIYSPESGLNRLDTLHIQNGKFQYTLPLEESTILNILYPNYAQLTIFAEPGKDIRIKGDAQNLNEVEVTGTEDNEQYTSFRKETLSTSIEQTKETAGRYALEHPSSALSRFLFSTYFLLDPLADTQATKVIYDSLCRAAVNNLELSKLSQHVRNMGVLKEGGQLPDFRLTTRPSAFDTNDQGRTITRKDYQGKYLLMTFWAGWKSESRSALFEAKRISKSLKERQIDLQRISYSLDADEALLADLEKRDSINYPSFCDKMGFGSILVQQWGIRDIPYFIFVGPDIKIIASGTNWRKDILPKIEKTIPQTPPTTRKPDPQKRG